jgi:hypothetical protein
MGDLHEIWGKFEIGFWHPFGPYTGLSAEEVLEWKGGEAARHGWTLWSFVYSSKAAEAWLGLLSKTEGPVYALCSHSPGARDPDAYQAHASQATIATCRTICGRRCLIGKS